MQAPGVELTNHSLEKELCTHKEISVLQISWYETS